ncbi:apelin receptor early endogenous ligand [Hypomesus transpacificus]|uniref:apelin receptor early endogenous ligand n=1 Tax=Hypomesus transpacificus TaxID=137520 RepID=UPI001F0808F8|nr:apelin receptor early endogenous ligand [Hypomesus transpacificus]
MRILNVLYMLLLLLAVLRSVSAVRPGKKYFLNVRRKYRHHCPYRRCMPLHSRVPFP